jgi:acyl carrier protein
MTSEELRQIVIDIIAGIVPDEDMSGLNDDEPLRAQVELDSMDFLDIILELRKQHKINVPEADYKEFRTMKSTVAYLLPQFNAE